MLVHILFSFSALLDAVVVVIQFHEFEFNFLRTVIFVELEVAHCEFGSGVVVVEVLLSLLVVGLDGGGLLWGGSGVWQHGVGINEWSYKLLPFDDFHEVSERDLSGNKYTGSRLSAR